MKKRRIISILLCAVLFFSMLPIGAVYADEQEDMMDEEGLEVISEEVSDSAEGTEEETAIIEETVTTEETAEIPELRMQQVQNQNVLESINQAVENALQEEVPDLESVVMQEFLSASNAYDELTETEIPEDTVNGMRTVRERIYEVIRSDQGVTASSSTVIEKIWFIKTNVHDASTGAEVLAKAAEKYPGCDPVFLYHKSIYYSDIRTGEVCRYPAMVSLRFPVPEGYDSAVNPQVLSYYNDQLNNLSPVRESEELFFVSSARTLTDLSVIDTPIALTGISMDETVKINQGQTLTLKVSPVPAKVTQSYSITWKSSNTAVAKVSSSGVVTAVKEGTAIITAAVKENTALKATCKVTVVRGSNALKRPVTEVMKETKAYILSVDKNPTVGSEWHVIGLARGGMSLDHAYFNTYYNHIANYLAENDGQLTNSVRYTEYSKTIISLTAMGKDASNIGGYNLLKQLADFEKVKAQGINGPIWALIAVNTNPKYAIPKDKTVKVQTTKELLIEYILSQEKNGGGWNLSGNSGDTDMTGMALQALAPYYQKQGYEEVTAAIDRALAWLSKVQNSSGGFSTMGSETIESCVQVITGLCALGIDLETDERFIKGGNWTVENLLSYHIKGSGFMHVKPGTESNGGGEAGELNGMATEQGYYAMVAYQRMKAGKTSLYDMSDLNVTKGGKGDGKGTGLEEPDAGITPTPTPEQTAAPEDEGNGGSAARGTVKGASGTTKKVSSANKTTKKASTGKTAKKKDGWDFDADEYIEIADISNTAVTENEAESSPNITPAEEVQGKKNGAAPWVAAGIGFGTAGGGGGLFLYRRRKGRILS